ncbi:MAG: hypothetical protein ACE5FU_08600, partial [Nitrospinota bacterium]
PETVSNDDIEKILEDAKSSPEPAPGGQESIDDILASAKAESASAPVDESPSPAPETVSNDDIEKILEDAKSTAGEGSAEKETTEGKPDASETIGEGPNPGETSGDILSEDMLSELLDGGGAPDPGGFPPETAEANPAIQSDSEQVSEEVSQDGSQGESNNAKEEEGAAENSGDILSEDMLSDLLSGGSSEDPGELGGNSAPAGESSETEGGEAGDAPEEEAGGSSGDLLSESDLDDLFNGKGGDDPGDMAVSETAEQPEAENSSGGENLDDLDKTVVADSSDQEETVGGSDDFDNNELETEESYEEEDGAGGKEKKGIGVLFLPFIKTQEMVSSVAGKLFRKKREEDDDEGEEEESEDDAESFDDGDDEGEGKKKKKKGPSPFAVKLLSTLFVASLASGGVAYYLFQSPTGVEPPVESGTAEPVAESEKQEEIQKPEEAGSPAVVKTENEPAKPEKPETTPVAGVPKPKQVAEEKVPAPEKKPALVEMAEGSKIVSMGVVLPVYRDPGNFKVLDVIIRIIFDSSKTASRIREIIPYYEMKIEESIDMFFSDKFYDDIPFVKNRLRRALASDLSALVSFGKVNKVLFEFLKIEKREQGAEEVAGKS